MTSTGVQGVLDRLQKANRVMEDLIDLALSDDKITDEEQEILFSINDNLQEFVKLSIKSVSDNVISDKESDKLKQLQTKIIEDANKVALKDSNVTDDEKALIDTLVESIKNLTE